MKELRLFRVSNRAIVALGRELGRGGEGSVHQVGGAPELVAKIYLKPPSPAKVDKLRSMSRHAAPSLLKAAAWPLDLLADESGLVRGFLMPKVGARQDLHELYSPKSRRNAFPNADFRFVVRAAANLARAVAQVHARGIVIGDVNHGNALVGHDGTVMLIDCDSFQVREAGRVFTCDVGVPLFTAPELSGQGFRGLRRTVNHDAFGLAVLFFHLLYMGRHPFAGKYEHGEMPIERAIRESRFAYGANAAALGMSAPPGTLRLGVFGPEIEALFMRAFAAPGEMARPAPAEWIDALRRVEEGLVPCVVSSIHFHPGQQACCWCAHEKATGLRAFGREVVNALAARAVQIGALWEAISAVQRPEPERREEFEPGSPDPRAADALGTAPRAVLTCLLVLLGLVAARNFEPSGLAVAVGYFVGAAALMFRVVPSSRRARKLQAKGLVRAARDRVAVLVEKWNRLVADDRFERLFQDLDSARRQLQSLALKRDSAVSALTQSSIESRRDRFLSTYMIAPLKIAGLGTSQKAMLASYGIDSADDVLREHARLPNLLPAEAVEPLVEWARERELRLLAVPGLSADPSEVREIERLLADEQTRLLAILSRGETRLRDVAGEVRVERMRLRHQLDLARRELEKVEREAG